MVFRPERYPANWKEIRAGILTRANNACEQCRAPNLEVIVRGEGVASSTYMLPHGEVFDATTGEYLGRARGSEYDGRMVKVILTVAHVDHDEQNNDPENLRALCQKCHLTLDAKDNAQRRRDNAAARAGQQLIAGIK